MSRLEQMIRKIEDEIDAEAIRQALREYEAGDTVSLEQLRDELGV